MDFQKKANREFFNSQLLFKTVGVIFLLIIFILVVSDFKIYQKKRELTAQITIYQKQIADIKKSSQNLKDEITNSDNPDYLEKIAYEQLGEQKPGETEYIFVQSPKKADTVSSPQNFWSAKSWFGWIPDTINWIKTKF